jgi:Fe-S cluster biogenesis protein NfuA
LSSEEITVSNAAVETALETIRPGLGADGYLLKVGESESDTVEVILEALPGACGDCLVPDAVLLQILEVALKDNGDDRSVRLRKVGFDGIDSH